MIRFLFPELFLLGIPLAFAYRRWGWASGMTGVLRIATLGVLLLALTGPEINLGGEGIDIVVVADRSRSLPTQANANIRELIQNLQNNRARGDRVGIVTFGSAAAVESILSHESKLGEYTEEILPDGSDLNDALHFALNLVKDNQSRPARILVLSDGESNGASPLSAARRAKEERVPIDYRVFPRLRSGDVAVDTLLLPEIVSPREPFQYAVWVYADRDTAGKVTVLRDGQTIVRDEQPRELTSGMNRLLFRDLLDVGGLFSYEVRLEVDGDPLLENNRGAGVVRVDAGPKLLVLNSDGQTDNFVRALEAGRIPVDVAAAKTHPLSQDILDRYRAVVLENIPAADLGRVRMERLAQYVEDLAGGMMLTGGERSFGTGGYFKSPLDDLLPVSMEMREEHRKTRLALAIALDRSGSMTAPVKGGKVKMDLANLGTAECVRLLSPGDSVAVIAVDSTPHIVQPLTPVANSDDIARKALGIQSMGGGIFVYEALVAAGEQLLKAEQSTKHIILFADAADSEEPGDYKNLLAKFDRAGITTSVIGLGTKADSDASLLEDIAKLGKGNILFTDDAQELPRLFTQDTMSVARSSFIKKDSMTQPLGISGRTLPSARLMGEYVSGAFPNVDGYNLSYLKPDATPAVISQDEYAAPWAAFWYRGLGRVAAVTLEMDGQYSGTFGTWDEYADFAITHARWLLGGGSPEDAYVTLNREGQDAVVTLELDPDRSNKTPIESPSLSVVAPGDERETALDLPFQWRGPNTLEARFKMTRTGTYRSLVKLGGRNIVRAPAVTLPYSPEFMPRAGLPTGDEILAAIGELTGGKARIDVLEVLADPPRSAYMTSLLPWLFSIALALLLLEIAGRRLSLWSKFVEATVPVTDVAAPARQSQVSLWEPLLRLLRRSPKQARVSTPSPVVELKGESKPQASETPPVTPPVPQTDDIFNQAKRRARKRLE